MRILGAEVNTLGTSKASDVLLSNISPLARRLERY